MGASASISGIRAYKGDEFNESYLKENFSGNFDVVDFKALKNENGLVPKDLLLSVHSRGAESEVFELFKEFCPGQGEMHLAQFIKFFEDSRLLKKNFSKIHAEQLFHQARFRYNESNTTVNYYLFREEVIPEYCRLRGLQEDALMQSLSRCTGPSNPMTEAEHMKDFRSLGQSLFMASAAVAANSGKDIITSAKQQVPEGPVVEVTPDIEQEDVETRLKNAALKAEQETAALKLQRISRGREARRKLREMKEIEAIRNNIHADSPAVDETLISSLLLKAQSHDEESDRATEGEENEAGIKLAFSLFCKPSTPDEMDIRDFVQLWRGMKVLTKRFTNVEAEVIFRKVVAKLQSLNDADPLKECLIFDKRINYVAFRSVAFALVAKSRSMTVDELASFILPSVVELHGERNAAAKDAV